MRKHFLLIVCFQSSTISNESKQFAFEWVVSVASKTASHISELLNQLLKYRFDLNGHWTLAVPPDLNRGFFGYETFT